MPDDQKDNEKKKKQKPTAQERRMYNKYAKHALATGEDVENMDTWVAKRRKQAPQP